MISKRTLLHIYGFIGLLDCIILMPIFGISLFTGIATVALFIASIWFFKKAKQV